MQHKTKSRTFRRVYVKTPGGKTKISYRKRKPSKAKCANCRAVLAGVPRDRPYKIRRLAKTFRRPERPFGGVLCSRCLKEKMIKRARAMNFKSDSK